MSAYVAAGSSDRCCNFFWWRLNGILMVKDDESGCISIRLMSVTSHVGALSVSIVMWNSVATPLCLCGVLDPAFPILPEGKALIHVPMTFSPPPFNARYPRTPRARFDEKRQAEPERRKGKGVRRAFKPVTVGSGEETQGHLKILNSVCCEYRRITPTHPHAPRPQLVFWGVFRDGNEVFQVWQSRLEFRVWLSLGIEKERTRQVILLLVYRNNGRAECCPFACRMIARPPLLCKSSIYIGDVHVQDRKSVV